MTNVVLGAKTIDTTLNWIKNNFDFLFTFFLFTHTNRACMPNRLDSERGSLVFSKISNNILEEQKRR